VKYSIKTFKSLYFILHTLRHCRPAPNVTVTLTRKNLEAAVYSSKNDRLHVLHIGLLICLCGRSTEQVPAGILEPCGILNVNNIIINNNYYNRASPSKSLKIISYSSNRLTRSNIVLPPPTKSAKYYLAYFISIPVHVLGSSTLTNFVGIRIAQNFEYKRCQLYGYRLRINSKQLKICIHVLGAAFSATHAGALNAAPQPAAYSVRLLYSSQAFAVF